MMTPLPAVAAAVGALLAPAAPAPATSGYVPHLAEVRWLIGHGLMDPGVTFAQEEIGWEICTDPPGGGTYRITGNRLTVRRQAGR
jgi:hypothetical protein